MKPNPIRWTEDELRLEIERLDAMIAELGDPRDLRALHDRLSPPGDA